MLERAFGISGSSVPRMRLLWLARYNRASITDYRARADASRVGRAQVGALR